MYGISRELIELGQDIVGKVAHGLATRAGPVHLQLLASQFYEAVRAELGRTPRENAAAVGVLAAAAAQCRRSAGARIAPALIVVELRAAVAILGGGEASEQLPPPRPKPQLRIIRGGLA
jgi:hypothetical protein